MLRCSAWAHAVVAVCRPPLKYRASTCRLATSRVPPAILEQHQQPDGSVTVPEVLCPWLKN
ncbi:hypothetical protein E6W39_06265 [Kitasatospora acidiphila]|uniref:Uncharacterized protein n=1 Tax=Kitasatospora acidiphila TaxID=2567942 RepID=A0A540VYZ3_9ACTN|nr:hypothetical protein E6W39_06265 [Kitasatospora acidiphila]